MQHPRLHDCHCYSHFLEATRFGPSTMGKESLIRKLPYQVFKKITAIHLYSEVFLGLKYI